nr:long-chain specific acyl-CoA dehydrogenase, mitochondrial-like [Lytechinus pictus]
MSFFMSLFGSGWDQGCNSPSRPGILDTRMISGVLQELGVSCRKILLNGPPELASFHAGREPQIFLRHQSSRPCPGQAETMMDIGTRAIFGEEHDMFRTTARRFFQEEVAPNQDRYEKQRHVDREIWEKMGAAGMLGVAIPAEKGGVGGDLLMTAITWEEQAYVNGAGTSFPLHSDIVMPYIAEYGTQEQIEKFLPDMAAGKKVGAIAMTEPSAGSDLQGIKTIAKKDGDDYILNGSKVFITNVARHNHCPSEPEL